MDDATPEAFSQPSVGDVSIQGEPQPDISRVDLTPREISDPDRSVAGPSRRTIPWVVTVLIVAALGFVLLRTLGDSALFFYNVDRALEQREQLGERRFNVQGTPFGSPVTVEFSRDGGFQTGVAFPLRFNGQVMDVVHVGAPAEQFQPGVPVVLEGNWVSGLPSGVDKIRQGAGDGWHFASTEMRVKHDNDYRNAEQDRLDEAERGGYVTRP